jgi:hypothetical protein
MPSVAANSVTFSVSVGPGETITVATQPVGQNYLATHTSVGLLITPPAGHALVITFSQFAFLDSE